MASKRDQIRWVESKFTREELQGKSVEFTFAVNNMRGNGVFNVDERSGLLSIAIDIYDTKNQEILSLHLHQMMAYLIERNSPGSAFEFRCFQLG